MTDAATRGVRSRRSGDEVRARMLTAARDVFAERGYAGATTKLIAERAEVGEVLLFRHFGNKAGLFDEAVLGPFESFVDDWADRWARHGISGGSIFELGRAYIELLYGFFDDNRELVVALLSAQAHHPDAAARLQALFARLAETVREGTAEYGLPPTEDPVATVRLTFGLVLSAVEHAELFFAERERPSRQELIDQLTRFMLYGVTHTPESSDL
ncbi:MAG TPA: helix-turn-helix domain-containing protein [Mycobacterium sp.]|nr:helix-turn-helix domain-containing protein [Mycobacterium sp.]